MKQPVGILVIMGYFLVAASTVLPALGSVPRLPLLQVSIVFANLVLMLFVAGGLFRMQGWSRWASIAMLAITLVRISIQLIKGNAHANTIVAIHALFLVWAIHYLTTPYAKSAFRLASLKRSRQMARSSCS